MRQDSSITEIKGIGEKTKNYSKKWEYTPLVIYSFIFPEIIYSIPIRCRSMR